MSENLISVCVHLRPGVDRAPIEQAVVGRAGKLRPKRAIAHFWASTTMTLKQVQSLDGVKDCTLSPKSW